MYEQKLTMAKAMAEGEFSMKKGIHPDYRVIKVKCSTCGYEHEVGTTAKEFRIDTCSNCHPFYTGQQSFITAAGRVEQFNKRYGIKSQNNENKPTNENNE
jgi:large subunit ribosomal protein L31